MQGINELEMALLVGEEEVLLERATLFEGCLRGKSG